MNCGTRTLPTSATRPMSLRPEVDEHHVLGALLLVAAQLVGEPLILVGRRAATARAGNRMRLDVPAFDAHEHLGRRADDGLLAHPDEEHVRRRVDVTQRAVDVERRRRGRRVEALRQHRLVDLAGGDVLLNLPAPRPRTSRASGWRRPRTAARRAVRRARGCARARARGSRSSRTRSRRAPRRSSPGRSRAFAIARIRCLT